MTIKINFFIFRLLRFLQVIVYLSIPFPFLYAQTNHTNECLELVRNIYKKLNTHEQTLSIDKVYYLDYQVKTKMRDTIRYRDTVSHIEVYTNNKRAQMLSDEMSVYQDEIHCFTVLPSQKIINWNDSHMNLGKEMRIKSIASFQDKLFEVAEVDECNDIQEATVKANKQVVLVLDKESQRQFPYVSLTFQIDTEQQTIHKILIDYPEPHKIARIELTFNDIVYDYKTDKLDKPVISLIFNEKQELLPKYKDFKLIDRRSQKK